MSVLYRDYRPKTFSEVINQEHIKTTLQNAATSGSFAHAYIFTGPRGTGKTSLARIFARAINCPNQKNGEPCNSCGICLQFLIGNSLDLIEIDAASNTGVENVREIIEHLRFAPTQASYKVFIIDEVHMLTKSAFNALLKTLEEPPKHAVFILATTEIHKVPATVISRSQRFDFKRIDNVKLLKHISEIAKKEKIDIDQNSLQLIVNASEGSVPDALSVLDKLSSFGKIDLEKAEMLLGITNVLSCQKLLDFLNQKDALAALRYIEELFSKGLDPIQFNKDFLEYLRKVLMFSVGANRNFPLDQTQLENLNRQAQEIKETHLLFIIRLFLRANKDFQISPSAELPLQIAIAESCLSTELKVANTFDRLKKYQEPEMVSEGPKKKAFSPENKNSPNEDSVINALPAHFDSENSEQKIITFEDLMLDWPVILQKVRAAHSALHALMQNAKVKTLEQNQLVLSFAYQFHKDSLENKKNRETLLKVLREHFGADFTLVIIYDKDLISSIGNSDASAAALDVFGGEIV